MITKEKQISTSGTLILLLVLINASILKNAFINNKNLYLTLLITLPILGIVIYNFKRKKV